MTARLRLSHLWILLILFVGAGYIANVILVHHNGAIKFRRNILLNGDIVINRIVTTQPPDRYSTKASQSTPHPLLMDPYKKMKVNTIHTLLNESSTHQLHFPAFEIGRYLMVDPDRCKNVKEVDLVILVHTAPTHADKRRMIRRTFANEAIFPQFHIRVAFLLGKSRAFQHGHLQKEYEKHKDLVMGDFYDSYHNLTLKGVMGYRWVKDYCSNSKLVMKIDDDVLINPYKFLNYYFPYMSSKRRSFFCNYWFNSTVPINRNGKWKVKDNVFYGMTHFPYIYCSGFMVVITTDLITSLYESAKITPFFWVDDIYLFGMLPYVVGKLRFYRFEAQKQTSFYEQEAFNCTRDFGQECTIFATLTGSLKSYLAYWNKLTQLFTLRTFINSAFIK